MEKVSKYIFLTILDYVGEPEWKNLKVNKRFLALINSHKVENTDHTEIRFLEILAMEDKLESFKKHFKYRFSIRLFRIFTYMGRTGVVQWLRRQKFCRFYLENQIELQIEMGTHGPISKYVPLKIEIPPSNRWKFTRMDYYNIPVLQFSGVYEYNKIVANKAINRIPGDNVYSMAVGYTLGNHLDLLMELDLDEKMMIECFGLAAFHGNVKICSHLISYVNPTVLKSFCYPNYFDIVDHFPQLGTRSGMVHYGRGTGNYYIVKKYFKFSWMRLEMYLNTPIQNDIITLFVLLIKRSR